MLKLRLRPHHILCLTFFEGKGYSSDFVINMGNIHKALKDENEIEIILGKDAICEKCPNMIGEGCTSQSKVERYDQQVAKLCGLKEGQVLNYGKFKNLAYTQIIEQKQLNSVCGDCQWIEICKKGIPVL
nr:DUF1284 domain-containing protein [uncultured Cellulosilyticum sp.]